ncbi:uncharacterized protein K489DRAFT_80727 [Dissoconium aciculare CBS 342.82]|uniref:Uncharacterized protein n=1 Tax=Dissoconium aciculare CBS 342.82 TaxID=1314786 RepID=A0A6J3LU67_9PEZI|nr:uncharacterized protein K489DRAFT_80727 [Dissoconium aciculare CBS 342.82]KAF1818819.1 hypothetical protein K489DRAFT_80727 [Dissoconium aciculare CBS 342.82]
MDGWRCCPLCARTHTHDATRCSARMSHGRDTKASRPGRHRTYVHTHTHAHTGVHLSHRVRRKSKVFRRVRWIGERERESRRKFSPANSCLTPLFLSLSLPLSIYLSALSKVSGDLVFCCIVRVSEKCVCGWVGVSKYGHTIDGIFLSIMPYTGQRARMHARMYSCCVVTCKWMYVQWAEQSRAEQSRAGGRDRSESDKAGKPRKSTTHPSHPDTVCARTHPGCNSNRIASRHISIAAASSKSPSSRARILAHSHHRRRRRSRLFPLPDVSRYYWGLAAIVLSLPHLVAALGWWSMACSAGRLLPGQTHTHSHHPPILSLP